VKSKAKAIDYLQNGKLNLRHKSIHPLINSEFATEAPTAAGL